MLEVSQTDRPVAEMNDVHLRTFYERRGRIPEADRVYFMQTGDAQCLAGMAGQEDDESDENSGMIQ